MLLVNCMEVVFFPYVKGWSEPYIYTVYDRIFGDFPAKDTVYAPYIHGSGVLANPSYVALFLPVWE